MKKIKLITIIIKTYNYGKFIEKAIKSILNQSLDKKLFEILVVNDGSTDNTSKILEKYKDLGLVEVIKLRHVGYIEAANTGMKAVKTEYLTFLDADDTLEPDALKEMLGAIQQGDGKKEIGFVYTDYYEKNEKGKVTVMKMDNVFKTIAGGILFRTDAVKEAGYYDKELIFPEYDLIIKIMKKYKKVRVDKPLYNYFRHSSSLTANKERVKKGREQLFAKYRDIPGLRNY
ncbi:glycosyltransferase [Candidatus Woesearchaeota archaeon]|nr:glycosyltransferase [Candidatus Woesearchaeota archaeon]